MKLSGKPGIVIPVTNMGVDLIPKFAFEKVGKGTIKDLQESIRGGLIQLDRIIKFVLEREACDLHFLVDCPGGSIVLLDQYRGWIDIVRQSGRVSRSYVPQHAGSAAALLAIETDECITRDTASFLFHAVAEAQNPEAIRRNFERDLAGVLGQTSVEPYEDPEYRVTPRTLADHGAVVSKLLQDARIDSPLKARVEGVMQDEGNERREFTISGAELASLRRAESYRSADGYKSNVFRKVGYLPGKDNRHCQCFWEQVK